MNEDYTAAVLSGIPIFLVNREYIKFSKPEFILLKVRYDITTHNKYKVSVFEFYNRVFSDGKQYRLTITGVPIANFTNPGKKFYGSDMYIHNLLTDLEQHGLERSISL